MKLNLVLRKLAVVCFLLYSLNSFTQVTFEKGFLINDSGEKRTCLIQNEGWQKNPSFFKFKTPENSSIQEGDIESVRLFSVPGEFKYERDTVLVDFSSESAGSLSESVKPEFENIVVFLRVLVEGEASLYEYRKGNTTRYFLKKDEQEIQPLIFKKYKAGNKIRTNEAFKNQLLEKLQCKSTNLARVASLNYRGDDLISFVEAYNKCTGSEFVKYRQHQTKDGFNLFIRPGVNLNSFLMEYAPDHEGNYDFGNKVCLRFGVEAEFILPVKRDDWTIVVEPSYQSFRVTNSTHEKSFDYDVDYRVIDLPLGVRHYFLINREFKSFVNGVVIIKSIALNNTMNHPVDLQLASRPSFAVGAGFYYRNNYSFEVRYGFNRDVLKNQVYWNGKFKSLTVTLGFKLF